MPSCIFDKRYTTQKTQNKQHQQQEQCGLLGTMQNVQKMTWYLITTVVQPIMWENANFQQLKSWYSAAAQWPIHNFEMAVQG